MEEISTSLYGFFVSQVSLAFALCSVGVLLTMLSFAAKPPNGMRGTSVGSTRCYSPSVDNHAVPFKGNTAATAASMPLNPIGPRWSIVKSPNNGSPGTNLLVGNTCSSASDCWAVGYSDIGSGYNTLIEHWNGSAWAIVSSPNNSGNISAVAAFFSKHSYAHAREANPRPIANPCVSAITPHANH